MINNEVKMNIRDINKLKYGNSYNKVKHVNKTIDLAYIWF